MYREQKERKEKTLVTCADCRRLCEFSNIVGSVCPALITAGLLNVESSSTKCEENQEVMFCDASSPHVGAGKWWPVWVLLNRKWVLLSGIGSCLGANVMCWSIDGHWYYIVTERHWMRCVWEVSYAHVWCIGNDGSTQSWDICGKSGRGIFAL